MLLEFCPFSWEPDPVEADPLKGSRNKRKVDILGMVVGIIGSKDQLVNEYRVILAEKLLNKSDYDIDSEIRTLELLKAGVLCIVVIFALCRYIMQDAHLCYVVFTMLQSSHVILCLCVPDTFWGEQYATV